MNSWLIKNIFAEHARVIDEVCAKQSGDIARFGEIVATALRRGNTIFFMGNGGSAADSQHLAAEFVGRFQKERRALPSVALTTDTSILTAIGNDYGFDKVFARQVEALAQPGDVVVGLSTSGNSANVLLAMQAAREQKALTIGMTGRTGGKMAEVCDLCIKVPSDITARIQEAHALIGHIICQIAEGEIAGV